MSDLLATLGILLPFLVGFLIYRYRNRIIWDVVTIDCAVPEQHPDVRVSPSWSSLYAERIEIKNQGLRNLENVELHLAYPARPITLAVSNPSTLSKSAIKTEWENEILKVMISHLPADERFHIHALRTGMPLGLIDRLKGTGGKYSLVWKGTYESNQRAVNAILALVAAICLAAHLVFESKLFS